MLICINDNEIGITHRGLHAKRNKESKRWVRTGIHIAEMPGADFLMELKTITRHFHYLERHIINMKQ